MRNLFSQPLDFAVSPCIANGTWFGVAGIDPSLCYTSRLSTLARGLSPVIASRVIMLRLFAEKSPTSSSISLKMTEKKERKQLDYWKEEILMIVLQAFIVRFKTLHSNKKPIPKLVPITRCHNRESNSHSDINNTEQ